LRPGSGILIDSSIILNYVYIFTKLLLLDPKANNSLLKTVIYETLTPEVMLICTYVIQANIALRTSVWIPASKTLVKRVFV